MPAVLSDTERKILDYMVRYLRANTYQPSVREIGEEFGIRSTKTVSEHLRALADKGYVERDPSRSRGIRILGVDLSPQTISVPCFTALPDDRSGFASDGVEAYLSIDRRMTGRNGCYFVRARGEAFRGMGIEDGDLILVEPAGRESIRDGDLAVVHVSGEPGLYRIRRKEAGLALLNGQHPSVEVSPQLSDRHRVTGKVTALYRRMDGARITTSPTAH